VTEGVCTLGHRAAVIEQKRDGLLRGALEADHGREIVGPPVREQYVAAIRGVERRPLPLNDGNEHVGPLRLIVEPGPRLADRGCKSVRIDGRQQVAEDRTGGEAEGVDAALVDGELPPHALHHGVEETDVDAAADDLPVEAPRRDDLEIPGRDDHQRHRERVGIEAHPLPEMNEIVMLFLVGSLGGIISGMFGIGGGVIYVVVFNIYLKKNHPELVHNDAMLVQLTLINSIFSIFFGALSGFLKQVKSRNFYPNLVLQTGIPALFTAILGTILVAHWEGYNKKIFFSVFTIFLIPMLLKVLPTKKEVVENDQLDKKYFGLTGLLTGLCTAFTGLGGGVVINPILNGLLKYPIKKTFSISQGVMLITTFGISIFHLFNKNEGIEALGADFYSGINLKMTFPVIIGMIIFAPFGVTLAQKTPAKLLQLLFAIVCLAIIIRNLFQIFGT
jgi:uncharacterized membrane protein YfcA